MQTNIQAALNRAQSHFKLTEARDTTVRAQLVRERAEVDEKTARLRALRLARDAEAATVKSEPTLSP